MFEEGVQLVKKNKLVVVHHSGNPPIHHFKNVEVFFVVRIPNTCAAFKRWSRDACWCMLWALETRGQLCKFLSIVELAFFAAPHT